MEVVIAVCTGPVPNRHPGRRLDSFGLQAQRLHGLVGDLCPLVVVQLAIPGRERQGHVRMWPPFGLVPNVSWAASSPAPMSAIS